MIAPTWRRYSPSSSPTCPSSRRCPAVSLDVGRTQLQPHHGRFRYVNERQVFFATGEQIDDELADPNDPKLAAFQQALDAVLLDLAQQIVRDGEGATKFVEVTVYGAADDHAKAIALAIGNSPLVKTALAAEDANWGRLVMAVGKSAKPPTATRSHLDRR